MARIYKRGEFWHADYFHQGRRIRTSLKTSDKREAHQRLKTLLKNPDVPQTTPARKDISLTNLLSDYIAFAKTEKTPEVVRKEGYILRNFLKFLPVSTIQQITTHHIRNYKMAISDKSPNTIRTRLIAVRALLKYAIMIGFLHQNPAHGIQFPKQPKQIPKYLNPGQFKALLSALPERSKDVIYFFAKTGLRFSEGLRLTWEDIKGKHIVVRQTKNPQQAFRIMPIDKKVQALLKRQSRIGECVFSITRQQIRDDFEKARKKTELKWATIHTLRHTFASNLVMSGVGIKTVQELLGHARIESTMIYAHLSMEHLEEAIKKLPY